MPATGTQIDVETALTQLVEALGRYEARHPDFMSIRLLAAYRNARLAIKAQGREQTRGSYYATVRT